MTPAPSLSRTVDPATGRRPWRIGLLVVGWFNLLSALAGGVGLIVTNGVGMGMPLSWLAGSPFDSYLGPGIILLLVVGGSQALAVLLQHRHQPWYPAAAAVAGIGMVIWIYVEVVLLPVYSLLHTVYFATGLLQLIFTLLCLGLLPADRSRSD